jgi:hypothetical protein
MLLTDITPIIGGPAAPALAKAAPHSLKAGTTTAEADPSENTERFWKVAADHLVPLKAPWLDFVPVRAEGTSLWVSLVDPKVA